MRQRPGWPSPALIISVVALIFAIGGSATAVTLSVTKHSISAVDLKKTVPGTLLPRAAFQQGNCPDPLPSSATTCNAVSLTMPAGGSRALVTGDGEVDNKSPGTAADAFCALLVDGAEVIHQVPSVGQAAQPSGFFTANDSTSFSLQFVTSPLEGSHTFGLRCSAGAGGPIQVLNTSLTAMTVRK